MDYTWGNSRREDDTGVSTEEEGQYYYKLVAIVADRYFSIYDGSTEYVIG